MSVLEGLKHSAVRYLQHNLVDRFSPLPADQEVVKIILDSGFDVASVACSTTDTWDAEWQALHAAGRMRLIRGASEMVLPGIAEGINIGSGGRKNVLAHMQNSGFSHAMDGLISFVETYDLPAGVLVNLRGVDPRLEKSKPHLEIGKRTDSLVRAVTLDSESVFGYDDPYGFKRELQAGLDRVKSGKRAIIKHHPDSVRRTYPMPKIEAPHLDVAEYVRRMEEIQETKGWQVEDVYKRQPISRIEAHRQVREAHPLGIIVTGNGFDPRALYDHNHSETNLYNVGYMGGAGPLALGMALELEPYGIEVVSLEGNQNTQQGNNILFNLAEHYPKNLFRYILQNDRGVSVGIADSLPFIPDVYRFGRTILTVPEQAGEFQSKRLEEGLAAEYNIDDDARAMVERIGPLPAHMRRVIDVIRQMTDRVIAQQLTGNGLPAALQSEFNRHAF